MSALRPEFRRLGGACAALAACLLLASPALSGRAKPASGGLTVVPGKVSAAAAGATSLPRYEPPPAYSEDVVITTQGKTIVMQRAVDHTKSRTEMKVEGKGMVIIDPGDEKGTMYMLMPEEKRAIKQSTKAARGAGGEKDDSEASVGEATQPADAQVEDLGEGTINGIAARKMRMTNKDGVVLAWFEKSTGAPLRMEGDNGGEQAVMEWKNRKVGPQPGTLFEVPKSYELMDMDEMMSQMGGMGRMGMGGMTKGMAGGMAGGMASNLGGSLGGSLGGMLGGPLGSMAGHYLGGKVGGMLGKKAVGAIH